MVSIEKIVGEIILFGLGVVISTGFWLAVLCVREPKDDGEEDWEKMYKAIPDD